MGNISLSVGMCRMIMESEQKRRDIAREYNSYTAARSQYSIEDIPMPDSMEGRRDSSVCVRACVSECLYTDYVWLMLYLLCCLGNGITDAICIHYAYLCYSSMLTTIHPPHVCGHHITAS